MPIKFQVDLLHKWADSNDDDSIETSFCHLNCKLEVNLRILPAVYCPSSQLMTLMVSNNKCKWVIRINSICARFLRILSGWVVGTYYLSNYSNSEYLHFHCNDEPTKFAFYYQSNVVYYPLISDFYKTNKVGG